MQEPTPIPFLDPGLEYVGVGKFRMINSQDLKDMKKPLAFTGRGSASPLAVLIPFHLWIEIQKFLISFYVPKGQS